MKKLYFVIMLLSFNLPVFAQSTITGTIFNSETKDKVPYVSIGIESKSTGTVSNNNGEFSLKIGENISQSDSVTFSSIGFKTIKYTIADVNKVANKIYLVPVTYELDEVIVTNRPTKSVILGRNHVGLGMLYYNFYTVNDMNIADRLSNEVGMLFKIKYNCLINSVNFHISQNQFKKVKLRLTFYSIENNLPKDIIVNQNIIFEITDKFTGWFNLDLKPYSIYINNRESIAVTLTLLEDEMSNERNWFNLSATALSNFTLYSRKKAMDEWKKSNYAVSMFLETTAFMD